MTEETRSYVEPVPALRFSEFSSCWNHSRLIDIAIGGFSNGVFNDPAKVGSGYRLINVKDMYLPSTINAQNLERVAISEDEFQRNNVKIGDLFFTRSSLVKEGIAHSNVFLDDLDDVTYDGHLIKMSVDQSIFDAFFLHKLLKTDSARRQLVARGKTGTMTTIGQEDISSVKLTFPALPEQRKIADFLGAMDARVDLLRRRRDYLRAYKKGIMQRLFAQDLRFTKPDGSAFPDWQEKRLGEVFQVTRGNVLAMPLVSDVPEGDKVYPVYSSQTKANGLAGYYDEFLYTDAITWTTDGANAGDTKYRAGKFYCTNVCGVLLSKDGHANAFMAELINSVSKHYVSYVGNPKLMNGVMASIKVPIPHLEEQRKIAETFTALDKKIDAVTAQIDAMLRFTKGLMQQMFV